MLVLLILVLCTIVSTFVVLFCLMLVLDCFKATVDALVKNNTSLLAVDRKQRTPLHYLVVHSRFGGNLWCILGFDTS